MWLVGVADHVTQATPTLIVVLVTVVMMVMVWRVRDTVGVALTWRNRNIGC